MSDMSPQSRNEEFLLGLLNGVTPDITPASRVECYLKALCEKGATEIPEVDATLTRSGAAADAKAVGDVVSSLSEEKVENAGWSADKYLGTDSDGKVVEKDAPDGGGGSFVIIDAAMSDTSENPVQNKVIKTYVDSAISGSWTEEY